MIPGRREAGSLDIDRDAGVLGSFLESDLHDAVFERGFCSFCTDLGGQTDDPLAGAGSPLT